MVALDRQEKGKAERSAIQEVERDYGIPVISIINLNQLIRFMEEQASGAASGHMAQYLPKVKAYRDQYGIQ